MISRWLESFVIMPKQTHTFEPHLPASRSWIASIDGNVLPFLGTYTVPFEADAFQAAGANGSTGRIEVNFAADPTRAAVCFLLPDGTLRTCTLSNWQAYRRTHTNTDVIPSNMAEVEAALGHGEWRVWLQARDAAQFSVVIVLPISANFVGPHCVIVMNAH